MTDAFTDEIFRLDEQVARSIVFPVSRLVVDPERFLDDGTEPMSALGMGVIYTRTSDGIPLRTDADAETRERLLAAYYEPHHRRLADAVTLALRRWDSCLVIDCHSFPSAPLPYELDRSPDRPEICLGTDEAHSPPALVETATDLFRRAEFRVALDRPFSGALVPALYHRREPRVLAIMIEVNRSLYMNEATGDRLPDFADLAARIRGSVTGLIEATRPADS